MYENVVFTADVEVNLPPLPELDSPPGIFHDVLLSLNLFQTAVNNFYRAMHVVLVRYNKNCYRKSSVRSGGSGDGHNAPPPPPPLRRRRTQIFLMSISHRINNYKAKM